jgi:ribonuclease Z
MKLQILGCYAATPTMQGNPTAQILDIRNHIFLIDCGEGTQVHLRKHKIKFSRINHIFISHLHGDHFFGLPGLISTFQLLGREKELHIYGPSGLKEAISLLLKLGNSWTSFPLLFHQLESKEAENVFVDELVSVSTIPLKHRIYTNGFLFAEQPRERVLNTDAVGRYKVDKAYFKNIKKGKDVVLDSGERLRNDLLSYDPPEIKKYAYCSDTAYDERIIPLIHRADLLYHEATFLQGEAHLAAKTKHSTTEEAARIAAKAEVKRLVLGHFSNRYKEKKAFLTEASEFFKAVELAEDGKIFEI